MLAQILQFCCFILSSGYKWLANLGHMLKWNTAPYLANLGYILKRNTAAWLTDLGHMFKHNTAPGLAMSSGHKGFNHILCSPSRLLQSLGMISVRVPMWLLCFLSRLLQLLRQSKKYIVQYTFCLFSRLRQLLGCNTKYYILPCKFRFSTKPLSLLGSIRTFCFPPKLLQLLLAIIICGLSWSPNSSWAKIGDDISDGYIKIHQWEENVYINPNSRRNVVKLSARAEKVKANTYIKHWIYSISEDAVQKGEASFMVEYATVNGKKAAFIPTANGIAIDVDRATNNKRLNIEFAYQIINKHNQPFYRVEAIFFGGFLMDVPMVKYNVIVDRSLIVCSVPKYFMTTDQYFYQGQGKITEHMQSQLFHVTQAYGLWSIRSGYQIANLPVPTQFFEIRTPRLFNEGTQVIMSSKVIPSTTPASATSDGQYYTFKFNNLQTSNLSVVTESVINNTKRVGSSAGYNPRDYGSISSADRMLLDKIASEIKQQHQTRLNEGKPVPLFVTVGEWVYNYLTYDASYVGTSTDLATILQNRKGVCEHYAVLFTALCRALNMPAFNISGYAFSEEEKKFIGHAWNFVYNNGKWYEVDPTWNLMSGVVPLSHLIYQRSDNKATQFRSTADTNYHVERINEITYLGEKEGKPNPKTLPVDDNTISTPATPE